MEMKLQDCCEAIVDCPHTTAPDEGEGYPLVRTPNIGKGRLIYNGMHRVSESVYKQRNKRMTPQPGDLIFAREAPAGNVAILQPGEFVCLGQRTVLLRVDKKVADSSYLAYYLLSPIVRHNLIELANGATVSHINIPDLKKLEISLPPLPVQRRIAAVLGALDDKIELNRKMNANLEAQAQALFKSWFVDFTPWGGQMPAGWKKGTLGEIVVETLNGDWGKDQPEGNNQEPVFCIRGADIPDVVTGNKGKMPLRYILPKNFAKKELHAGNVVVEISGGSPTQSTGRSALISEALLSRYERGIVCTNFCKALSPVAGYSAYLYYLWRSLYDRGIFFGYENGTTGIKNLSVEGVLTNEEVVLPPRDVVETFADKIGVIHSVIFQNGKQSEKLAELRDALLPKLMSGELEVA